MKAVEPSVWSCSVCPLCSHNDDTRQEEGRRCQMRRPARRPRTEWSCRRTKARQPPHRESCTRHLKASGRSTPAGAKPLRASNSEKGELPCSSALSPTNDDSTATRTKPWRLNRLL